jgi:hypothetical protein
MTDVQEQSRRARALLDDEVLQAAVLTVEENIILRWRKAETPADREATHAQLRGLTSVVTELRRIITNGEFEEQRAKLKASRNSNDLSER